MISASRAYKYLSFIVSFWKKGFKPKTVVAKVFSTVKTLNVDSFSFSSNLAAHLTLLKLETTDGGYLILFTFSLLLLLAFKPALFTSTYLFAIVTIVLHLSHKFRLAFIYCDISFPQTFVTKIMFAVNTMDNESFRYHNLTKMANSASLFEFRFASPSLSYSGLHVLGFFLFFQILFRSRVYSCLDFQ